MSKTSKTIRKMFALVGITMVAATATAFPMDARIMIDRALNSPTLTVRYTGANAALVEIKVNGESLGTRAVSASKSAGETNFTLNLSELKDGDNEVEIRLFDRTGKLVGSDKTNISTDQTQYGPVFLRTPKVGQQVRGPVEINLGFGRELKNVYVSFFVDNNFKKISNFPPYSFMWDTTTESNGWHEVEAWAIDESTTTYKTRKTRVFVNNPGGRTDRKGVVTDATPVGNAIHSDVVGGAGIKSLGVKGAANAAGAALNGAAPKGALVATKSNAVHANLADASAGLKPIATAGAVATGVRNMTPTVSHVAVAKAAPTKVAASDKGTIQVALHSQSVKSVGSVINSVASAANLVRITRGQRLPNLTTFAVVLNSQFVDFDVNPRVDDGVPMTPFRHLLEKAGGKVDWENLTKTVKANAEGKDIVLQIGDKNAKVNKLTVSLEIAPYIDRGRTIVPLSFLHEALNVDVEYDKETGHVLITTAKK